MLKFRQLLFYLLYVAPVGALLRFFGVFTPDDAGDVIASHLCLHICNANLLVTNSFSKSFDVMFKWLQMNLSYTSMEQYSCDYCWTSCQSITLAHTGSYSSCFTRCKTSVMFNQHRQW